MWHLTWDLVGWCGRHGLKHMSWGTSTSTLMWNQMYIVDLYNNKCSKPLILSIFRIWQLQKNTQVFARCLVIVLSKLSFVQGLTTEGLLAEVRQRAPVWQHRDRRLLVTPMRYFHCAGYRECWILDVFARAVWENHASFGHACTTWACSCGYQD